MAAVPSSLECAHIAGPPRFSVSTAGRTGGGRRHRGAGGRSTGTAPPCAGAPSARTPGRRTGGRREWSRKGTRSRWPRSRPPGGRGAGPWGWGVPCSGCCSAAACEGASNGTWITVPTCTPSSCCSVNEASTWSGSDGSGSWPETSVKGDVPRPGTTPRRSRCR